MLFIFLFLLTVALNMVMVPVMLYKSTEFGKISVKQICSSLFALGGVFAMLYSRPSAFFCVAMLIGFFCSWWGDYFLHKAMSGKAFACGVFSFMLAHCSYISAFSFLLKRDYGVPYIDCAQFGCIAVITVISAAVMLVRRYKRDFQLLLVFVYGIIISTMTVKASFLGIIAYLNGVPGLLPTIFLGGFTFVISDLYILVQLYNKNKSIVTWRLNLLTYYIAQTLLCAGIFFV